MKTPISERRESYAKTKTHYYKIFDSHNAIRICMLGDVTDDPILSVCYVGIDETKDARSITEAEFMEVLNKAKTLLNEIA